MIILVIFAIIAHIGYALNDFSGALAARKMDGKLMTLMSWLCGTAIYLIIGPFFLHLQFKLMPLLAIMLLSVLFTLAYPLFLKSIKGGNATISGVIAGTFPLWTILASLIFYGERLTGLQALIISVIIIGVVLSALHLTRKTRLHNLFNTYSFLAFLVSLMWGFGFALWKYPVEQLGWFETSYLNNIFAAVISMSLFYRYTKGKLIANFKKYYAYPVVNALTGTAATMAYSYAVTKGSLSILAPIAGSYGGLYAVLSYYKFRESLTKLQLLGIILILGGVISLSILVARS